MIGFYTCEDVFMNYCTSFIESAIFSNKYEIIWRSILKPKFFNAPQNIQKCSIFLKNVLMWYILFRWVPVCYKNRPSDWMEKAHFEDDFPFSIPYLKPYSFTVFIDKKTQKVKIEISGADNDFLGHTIEPYIWDERFLLSATKQEIGSSFHEIYSLHNQIRKLYTQYVEGAGAAISPITFFDFVNSSKLIATDRFQSQQGAVSSNPLMSPMQPNTQSSMEDNSVRKFAKTAGEINSIDEAARKMTKNLEEYHKAQDAELLKMTNERNQIFLKWLRNNQRETNVVKTSPLGHVQKLTTSNLAGHFRPRLILRIPEQIKLYREKIAAAFGIPEHLLFREERSYRKILENNNKEANIYTSRFRTMLSSFFSSIYDMAYAKQERNVFKRIIESLYFIYGYNQLSDDEKETILQELNQEKEGIDAEATIDADEKIKKISYAVIEKNIPEIISSMHAFYITSSKSMMTLIFNEEEFYTEDEIKVGISLYQNNVITRSYLKKLIFKSNYGLHLQKDQVGEDSEANLDDDDMNEDDYYTNITKKYESQWGKPGSYEETKKTSKKSGKKSKKRKYMDDGIDYVSVSDSDGDNDDDSDDDSE